MDVFFENAQQLFDVARADASGESNDFALLVRPDGGLHFVMESALSLDAVALNREVRSAYRVTKDGRGVVRVAGRSGNRECVLEQHASQVDSADKSARRFSMELLRDQPLYRINSPLTLSAAS